MNVGVTSEVCLLHGTCGLQGSPHLPTHLNLLQNLNELLSLWGGGAKTDGTKQMRFLDSLSPPSVPSSLQKQMGGGGDLK